MVIAKPVNRSTSLLRCKLCGRVTAAVFATILAIEAVILAFSVDRFEYDRLMEIEREALVVARAIIRDADLAGDVGETIMSAGPRLRDGSVLVGLTLYDERGDYIGSFGESAGHRKSTIIVPEQTVRGARGEMPGTRYGWFDVTWTPNRLTLPYAAIAKIDGSEIDGLVSGFITRIIGLVLIISFVVTVVTMLVIERLILRPIRKVHEAMAAVIDDPTGHDAPRVGHFGFDEFSDVTRGFDELTDQLGHAFARIERQNEILRDAEVTERTNEAKSAFMASMSHELRTPMNAILGFAEVIRREDLGPLGQDVYKEYASDILVSGHHLLGLINHILEIDRLEAGDYHIEPVPVDITDVFDRCVAANAGHASARGITLVVDVGEQATYLIADKRAFETCVENLIANALDAAPPTTMVKLTSTRDGDDIVITVCDRGPGIPQKVLASIDDPFAGHTVDPHAPSSGAGLGLAITHNLMALHDGTMVFDTNGAHGTRVSLVFRNQEIMATAV